MRSFEKIGSLAKAPAPRCEYWLPGFHAFPPGRRFVPYTVPGPDRLRRGRTLVLDNSARVRQRSVGRLLRTSGGCGRPVFPKCWRSRPEVMPAMRNDSTGRGQDGEQHASSPGEGGQKKGFEGTFDGYGATVAMFHQPAGGEHGRPVSLHQVAEVVEARNGTDGCDGGSPGGEFVQLAAVQPEAAQYDGLAVKIDGRRRQLGENLSATSDRVRTPGSTPKNETLRSPSPDGLLLVDWQSG